MQMKKPVFFVIWAFASIMITGAFSFAQAAALPNENAPYHLPQENQDIAAALEALAKDRGIALSIDSSIKGRIYRETKTATSARTFLDKLSKQFGLVWFFDGQTLYVLPNDKVGTEVFSFKQNDAEAALATLRQLGLYDPRFIHKYDQRGRLLLVRAPSPYLKIVKQTLEAMEQVETTKVTVLRGSKSITIPPLPVQSLTGPVVPGVSQVPVQ